MAEQEAKTPTETTVEVGEKKLKYLDFVQVAVVYGVVWFTSVYTYAKENAGPLKPGVQTVEGTVKTVIGPVYEKLYDIPFELLKFVDHKMDEVLKTIDSHVPCLMKQAFTQARALGSEIHQTGVVNTGTHLLKTIYAKYEPSAKNIYTKYEPAAEQYAVLTWRSLNRVPLFAHVAGIVVPTGVYWAEKYNKSVSYVGERGFVVAGYLPIVPIEKIGKIFEGGDVATNGEYVATNGEYMATNVEDVATNGEDVATNREYVAVSE